MAVSITPSAKFFKDRFPRFWIECKLRLRPSHFEQEFWLVPTFCDKSTIAIDIGANAGEYTYYLSRFSHRVIAFEPNANLCKRLKRFLKSNVQLESLALSANAGNATLRIDQNDTGGATIEERNRLIWVEDINEIHFQSVETRTLDSYRFSNVSMIKIDVEGHEESVINGALDTIRRNYPVLLIESEDRHNPGAPRRLAQMMSVLGYGAYYIKDRQLRDFSTLRNEDTDPKNLLSNKQPYINNFIFIPMTRSALASTIVQRLSNEEPGRTGAFKFRR